MIAVESTAANRFCCFQIQETVCLQTFRRKVYLLYFTNKKEGPVDGKIYFLLKLHAKLDIRFLHKGSKKIIFILLG